MSSDRGMNVLRLDFVRDPDLAVRTCLGKELCEELLGHFYVAWTVLFRTPEREAAAEELLRCLDRRGLGRMRPDLLRKAGDARAAVRDDPDLRRALRMQGADPPEDGVPADGGDDGDDDSDPARGRGA